MSKLIYILPDVEVTEAVVSSIMKAGIDEEKLHVVANDKIELGDLPVADIEEESDVVPALARGAAVGGATGILAGIAAATFPPAGITLGGGALLLGALGGTSFGTWAAAMIGVSVPNSQLREYQDSIDAGAILLLVDVDDDQDNQINQIVSSHAPDVLNSGVKDSVPPVL